jgi:hypothetical protein
MPLHEGGTEDGHSEVQVEPPNFRGLRDDLDASERSLRPSNAK